MSKTACERQGLCTCRDAWWCRDGIAMVDVKEYRKGYPRLGPAPITPAPGQCLACTETTFRFGCGSRCPTCPAEQAS